MLWQHFFAETVAKLVMNEVATVEQEPGGAPCFRQGVAADASTPYQIDADKAETIIANQGMATTMIRTNGQGLVNQCFHDLGTQSG